MVVWFALFLKWNITNPLTIVVDTIIVIMRRAVKENSVSVLSGEAVGVGVGEGVGDGVGEGVGVGS